MTDELERTPIDPKGRSFNQIAHELARVHDPDFPPLRFNSPLATTIDRPRREGSESIRELIQGGRGWRYHVSAYDWGPGEIGSTLERTATAVHPRWTLTVHFNETSGAPTQRWSTLQTWEEIPDRGVDVEGLAEIQPPVFGSAFSATLITGVLTLEHTVRVVRCGHIRWQGRIDALSPGTGGSLPLGEGDPFMARLDGAFLVQERDVLEAFMG